VLRAHPVIGPAILRVTEQWPKASIAQQHPVISETEIAAAEGPLFKTYLEVTPNCDIDIEYFLTALRANLLDRAVTGENAPDRVLNVCAALARQCFVNEYVFHETASETARVLQLAAIAQSSIRSGAPLAPFQISALAMYRSLYSLEDAERLLTRDWPAAVADIVRQQVAEPAEEAALRDTTPKLTAIDDSTSIAVRAQYEENPYPRWVRATSTSRAYAIGDVLRRSLPPDDCPAIAPLSAPEVLIAGCGTGLQAVTAAQTYLNARIFAIDLSAASLAYARRQAAGLNLANIDFAQADILKLNSLDRRFDLIECGGVLHHLADPYAGWQTLLTLLRPGGLMRIALYSDIARRDVVAAHEFAAAGNYQPDLEGIRLCRQAILRLPKDAKAHQVLLSADFYSTSAFRDLVMHKQEHRMSLPDIQGFLAANKLEFIGFDASNQVRRNFKNRFPDPASRKDLAAWHQFETENPDTFITMYQFWVRNAPDA
jgi:SAM-dependent methyltransferase